jgi:hypothetical protein
MVSRTKRLKRISDAGIRADDIALRGFRTGLNSLARDWRGEITDLLGRGDTAAMLRLADIRYVSNEIQGQINRLGYEPMVRQFMANYSGMMDRAVKTLDALKIKPQRLSSISERTLAGLRSADYSYLMDIGEGAARQVAHSVVLGVLGGAKKSEMVEEIGRSLDTRLNSYASTYAETALVSYGRRVNVDMWQAAGVQKMLYRGPQDVKTRPFCEQHVGKVYTVAEINAMDNGPSQPKPVLYYGGGWNCRHVWSPVPDDASETEEEE